MALTTNEEERLRRMLISYENGKRIGDLARAQGSAVDMQIVVEDGSGRTCRLNLKEAVAMAVKEEEAH